MHRDFKSANILINANCSAKICDFGLARTIPETCSDLNGGNTLHIREKFQRHYHNKYISKEKEQELISKELLSSRHNRDQKKRCLSMKIGTRWYRAPEISLLEKHYDQASDMWSFGCILFELMKYATRESDISQEDFTKERFLFQGNSCFPMTPL